MTLDACIAHAIHSDLDIVEALPEVMKVRVEEIEPLVEKYVAELQEGLSLAIQAFCEPHLERRDAAGLCEALLAFKLPIPVESLRAMCVTIVRLYGAESRQIGHILGKPVYEMKMTVRV